MPSVRTVVSGGNPARARTSRFCGPFVFSRAVEPSSERARRIAAVAEIKGRLPRTTVVMLAAPGGRRATLRRIARGCGVGYLPHQQLAAHEPRVAGAGQPAAEELDCRDRGAAVRLAGDRAQPRRLACFASSRCRSRSGGSLNRRVIVAVSHVSGARAKAPRAGKERLTTQEQPEGLRILAPRMVVAATEKRKSDE
jgi:hypothetical protein